MTITLDDILEISEGATDKVSINLTADLDGSELAASATVTEVTTSALTLTNLSGTANTATVNAATVEIKGATVAIGKAIQWMVSGQKAGTTYIIKFTVTTDSSPARVLPRNVKMVCT
jgi:hypothetical protein